MSSKLCRVCGRSIPRGTFRCFQCGAPQSTITDLAELEDRSLVETHLYYLGTMSRTLAFVTTIGVRMYLGIIVIAIVLPNLLIGGITASPSVLEMVPPRLRFLMVDMADDPTRYSGLILHMIRVGIIGFILWGMLYSVGKAARHRYVTGSIIGLVVYGGMILLFRDTPLIGPFAVLAGIVGIYLAIVGSAAVDSSYGIKEEIRILFHQLVFSLRIGLAKYFGHSDDQSS